MKTPAQINERWYRLLKHPHFKSPDLPPSRRRAQQLIQENAEAAMRDDALREMWAGTTPQGREIIRKKLHALHKRLADLDSQQDPAGNMTQRVPVPNSSGTPGNKEAQP